MRGGQRRSGDALIEKEIDAANQCARAIVKGRWMRREPAAKAVEPLRDRAHTSDRSVLFSATAIGHSSCGLVVQERTLLNVSPEEAARQREATLAALESLKLDLAQVEHPPSRDAANTR